jgi:hypothetical protein
MGEDHLIINAWLKTYLIGPMEEVAEGDGGRGWRMKIREDLAKRVDKDGNPIYTFDPTLEEQNKIGMEAEIFHKKVKGWLSSGNNEKIKEHGKLIWKGKTYIEKTAEGQARLIHIMGDIDYVKNSNFLIARMGPQDKPCGTFMECGIALEHNIPIYVLQTMARTEYSGSFAQAVLAGDGEFFPNQTQLLEFIDKKYNLKVVEPEKSK